jgi:hypothetical protein
LVYNYEDSVYLNNVYKFSPYLTGKILCLRYKTSRLMLFREIIAICCENHTDHTNNIYSVRTSQETYYVSATKLNRLILFSETVAVYCENHTEHTNNIYSVRTSQETHYVSATKPNRLILFRETVAVCCENYAKFINTLCEQNKY